MNKSRLSPKYYIDAYKIRKQLPSLLGILFFFLMTISYAMSRYNPTVRAALLYLSLVYPCVILLTLLCAVPNVTYFQLDAKGIHITKFVYFKKHIWWSEIASITEGRFGNLDGIGIEYVDSSNGFSPLRKLRVKMFGYDELLGHAHTKEGKSFIPDVFVRYKKYLKRVEG